MSGDSNDDDSATPTNELSPPNDHRGILCNDPSGLCLAWHGAIESTDAATAGVYTNLTRLASKLSHNNDDAAPLITLETESAAWLVKEYDGGHAVALKVPSRADEGTNGELSTAAATADSAAGNEISSGP